MLTNTTIIAQTKKWIETVVIGCNFCPFAAKEVKNDTIKYVVAQLNANPMEALKAECDALNNDTAVETTLIIFPNAYLVFAEYLLLVDQADNFIKKNKYKGIYQIASFHPDYCFEGEDPDDASNYTNRSIYPMLHILREDSIYAIATKQEAYLETIPTRNITFALAKGKAFFEMLRQECLAIEG
jgi:uncharacterized protein